MVCVYRQDIRIDIAHYRQDIPLYTRHARPKSKPSGNPIATFRPPAPLRVGLMALHSTLVVGCGSIGERHLRCFLQTGRATLTGCDTNTDLLQAIATKYSVLVQPDWQSALATRSFDTVVICTPAPFHIPIACRALELGIHVLIEKPLSHSLEGVDELLRARDRSRCQAAVAYVLHQYPFLAEARAFLAKGQLGPVLHASVV